MNGDYTITANFAQSPTTEYDLIINSMEGGVVTTPGYVYLQGTFTYNEGDVVNLVATPGAGYQFVNWTGNVGTIANVNSASTTITMNGDYTITANLLHRWSPQATVTLWGLRTMAPWSPLEATATGSAMSAAGRLSSRSPQAGFTQWGLEKRIRACPGRSAELPLKFC